MILISIFKRLVILSIVPVLFSCSNQMHNTETTAINHEQFKKDLDMCLERESEKEALEPTVVLIAAILYIPLQILAVAQGGGPFDEDDEGYRLDSRDDRLDNDDDNPTLKCLRSKGY